MGLFLSEFYRQVTFNLQKGRAYRLVQATTAIYVRGLTKYHGNRLALHGLDLDLGWGEVLSVFGPNGSGKTTLVRLLSGLSRPTSGSIRIAGLNPENNGVAVRQLLGVLSHQTFLYDDLTVLENLKFHARMFGINDLDTRIEEASHILDITAYLNARVRTLSHGMQKRVSLTRLLIHHPRLLILDEPEAGLDEEAISLVGVLLKAHRSQGGAAIVTTHNVERGISYANRIIILSKGRISYDTDAGVVDPNTFRETYRRQTGVQPLPPQLS